MGPFEKIRNMKFGVFLVAAAAAQYAGDGNCANRESCLGSGNRGDLVCCTEADLCTNSTLIANDLWANSVSGNCTDFPVSTTTEAPTTVATTSGAVQTTLSAFAALLIS